MSSKLSRLDDFVSFARKDAWNAIKKDPERAFIGAIDPASSWVWSQLTGKDYDPIINMFGSPAGGGEWGFDRYGGTYGRAEEAGVDTQVGRRVFGIGDAIAGFYGGSAAGEALGGIGGTTAGAPDGSGLAIGSDGSIVSVGTPGSEALTNSASSPGLLSGFTGGANGSGSTFGSAAKSGAGLLGSAQQQPQAAPMQQAQPVDVQAQQAARIRMQEQMQLQALRQKPNKTMDEWMQLQKASRNQGLLG